MTKKQIGLYTATAIVAANMIGTGVFTSLGFQVISINSGFAILALWLIGGIAALSGALSYGELGASMPRSGGEYHLLSKIYHPIAGFLSGWISVAVGFSAPIAAAAMAMGKYSSKVLIDTNLLSASSQDLVVLAIAITVVTLVSIVHLFDVKFVSKFQVFFTGLKITLIILLIVFGFILGQKQAVDFSPNAEAWKAIFSAPFAISLVFVMYAYSGWNASVYIASDIEKPGKNLPMSLILGTLLVVLLYVPINGVFLYSTPIDKMVGIPEVGYVAATSIFGEAGGVIMGLLISLGLISAISSMIWAGPRVTYIMGEDTHILRFLTKKNKNGVPYISLSLQLSIVIFLIKTATFDAIITYIGFLLSLSSFLTVLGVFIMRFREPKLERPYKTWGYPVTPLIYLAITGWMMFFVLKDRPQITWACLATIVVGVVLYFINYFVAPKSKIEETHL